jgi:hypothetical protein
MYSNTRSVKKSRDTPVLDRDLYEQSPSAGYRTVYAVMGVAPEAWRWSDT